MNHIRSKKDKNKNQEVEKSKRCAQSIYICINFHSIWPYEKSNDDRRIASRKGARNSLKNGCRTDVEQLRINWFADEIQLRTNSRQDEQSNRNECAPHTSKRTEKRESTTCSIHRPSSLRASIDFPLPFFFLFFIPRGHDSSIRTKRNRCCYTLLRIQFDLYGGLSCLSTPSWLLEESKNRIGKAMDRSLEDRECDRNIFYNFLDFSFIDVI